MFYTVCTGGNWSGSILTRNEKNYRQWEGLTTSKCKRPQTRTRTKCQNEKDHRKGQWPRMSKWKGPQTKTGTKYVPEKGKDKVCQKGPHIRARTKYVKMKRTTDKGKDQVCQNENNHRKGQGPSISKWKGPQTKIRKKYVLNKGKDQVYQNEKDHRQGQGPSVIMLKTTDKDQVRKMKKLTDKSKDQVSQNKQEQGLLDTSHKLTSSTDGWTVRVEIVYLSNFPTNTVCRCLKTKWISDSEHSSYHAGCIIFTTQKTTFFLFPHEDKCCGYS